MKEELKLRKSFDEIDDKMDQFFIRMIDGRIRKERMVRLPGGMPSTVRIVTVARQANCHRFLVLTLIPLAYAEARD